MRCSDDAEKPKNAPQEVPGFPIIKSAPHCGKITVLKKKRAFYGHGFRSGGMFLIASSTAAFPKRETHTSSSARSRAASNGAQGGLGRVGRPKSTSQRLRTGDTYAGGKSQGGLGTIGCLRSCKSRCLCSAAVLLVVLLF